MKLTYRTSLAVLSTILLSCGAASAAVVSVSFDLPSAGTAAIASGTSLGVVASSNWNNISTTSTSVAAGSLVAADPADNPYAATISLAFAGNGDTWNTDNTGNVAVYSDNIRLTSPLVISGVVGTYDLIVYARDFGTGNAMSLTLNGTITQTGTNNELMGNTYVINDNYFRFTNLTGTSSLTVANSRQVGGFQIVQIPEPTSLMAFSLGLGILALRRRRA